LVRKSTGWAHAMVENYRRQAGKPSVIRSGNNPRGRRLACGDQGRRRRRQHYAKASQPAKLRRFVDKPDRAGDDRQEAISPMNGCELCAKTSRFIKRCEFRLHLKP